MPRPAKKSEYIVIIHSVAVECVRLNGKGEWELVSTETCNEDKGSKVCVLLDNSLIVRLEKCE